MKLAFSTLGVPGLPVPEVLALAAAHGYDGVELRAHPEEPVHPGLSPARRAETAAQFAAAGVEVLAVAGYARVAAPGDDAPVLDEIRALLRLAHDLGAGAVRVFPAPAPRCRPRSPTPSRPGGWVPPPRMPPPSVSASCWRPTTRTAPAPTRSASSGRSGTGRWARCGT